eukprot:m.18115 g.18115  ORF g.18115 m.18115 type:complete len:74 (+) comp27598_c0_seq1:3939-4160(+)
MMTKRCALIATMTCSPKSVRAAASRLKQAGLMCPSVISAGMNHVSSVSSVRNHLLVKAFFNERASSIALNAIE